MYKFNKAINFTIARSFIISLVLFLFIIPYKNLLIEKLNFDKILNAGNAEASLNTSPNIFYLTPEADPNFWPIRNWNIPFIELKAKSAIVTDENAQKILYQKNIDEKMPIGSLTKLMTAIVVLENFDKDSEIIITNRAIKIEGDDGFYAGEKMSILNLIKAMLIKSSNDAAEAISEHIGRENLLNLMNKKASDIGMGNTYFSDYIGLDDINNHSTTYDIAKLSSYILNNEPLILDIIGTKNITITSSDQKTIHTFKNTNKLLEEMPEIIGGKTGFTEISGQNLMIISNIANNKSKIISVVLNSPDRFLETKKIIDWIKIAYKY